MPTNTDNSQDCAVTRQPTHIDNIRAGDTVEIDGVLKTVCPKDIKTGFMGTTLFGDSYCLGMVPVIKATPIHVKPNLLGSSDHAN